MTLNRSFGGKGRLVTILAAGGLVLGGCVLAVASGGPDVVLADGKTVRLKSDEFFVPAATRDHWRRQLGESKVRLLARCNNDTGLCTTVVVPLVTADPLAPSLPDIRCPGGQVPVENPPDGKACLLPVLFDPGLSR